MNTLKEIQSGSVLIDSTIFLAALRNPSRSAMYSVPNDDCIYLLERCKSGNVRGYYTPETACFLHQQLAKLGVENTSERIRGLLDSPLRMLEINDNDVLDALDLRDGTFEVATVKKYEVAFAEAAGAYAKRNGKEPPKAADEVAAVKNSTFFRAAIDYCAFRRIAVDPIFIASARLDYDFVPREPWPFEVPREDDPRDEEPPKKIPPDEWRNIVCKPDFLRRRLSAQRLNVTGSDSSPPAA